MNQNEDLRRKMAEVIQQYLQLDTALRQAEGNYFRVCIFGSARIQPNDAIYQSVYEVARKLALLGIDIVTGGGPGLMEAANRAVQEAHVKRVRSYGLPLDIPGIKELPNPHLDIKSMHQRFSSRLDEFMRLSDAVIVAPGGIGTLLELFYVWQLLQLSMVEPRPVLLLGKEFWSGLLEWMEDQVLDHRLISPPDLGHVTLVDTPDEAVEIIRPVYEAFREKRKAERRAARLTHEAETSHPGEKPAESSLLPTLPPHPGPNGNGLSLETFTPKSPVVTPVEAVTAAVRQSQRQQRRRRAARRR